MRKIYKYEFKIEDNFKLDLPLDHEILKVDMQTNTPCMWIIINPEHETYKQSFSIHGTGHEIEDPIKKNIGTIFQGPLVWHVFKDY